MPDELRCSCGGKLEDFRTREGFTGKQCVEANCCSAFSQPALDGLRRMREIIEDERPYWMWHAMLNELAQQGCEFIDEYGGGEECPSRGDCITEWCLPCAARAFEAALAANGGK
jgi:hypothetical protein